MKVATIQTTLRKFFHYWITVTYPLHNLGLTDRNVLSELLFFRYKLSLEVTNERLINKLLFSIETKEKITKAVSISKSQYAQSLTHLRKAGIIKNKMVNLAYVPELSKEDTEFVMAYKFKIVNNGSTGQNSKKV